MSTPTPSGPVIGITADSEKPGGYSKFPWYALRQNYCSAVSAAGGVPVMLPHDPGLIDAYLDLIDGLLVSGGAFDVDPALFGAAERHAAVSLKEGRTDFELGMTRAAIKAGKPVFGICGGEQLLAVALGGTLIQHIPDEVPNALSHEQPNPRNEPGHDVTIVAGTQLHRVTGVVRAAVNSAHHQSVKTVPAPVVVSAVSSDGVIEGIEDPRQKFCLGVQWHPEFDISAADTRLFKAFIDACRP
jgi:putative glutamine amidotransferase